MSVPTLAATSPVEIHCKCIHTDTECMYVHVHGGNSLLCSELSQSFTNTHSPVLVSLALLSSETTPILLGECKAFVGERNEWKRQGRLCLHIAWGRMRTDWSVDDI